MSRPTGMDEENIIVILSQPFAEDFREEGYLDNARKADLELLRATPGIRNAVAVSQVPLSGSGSSSGFKPLDAERDTLATGVLYAGHEAADTLGVEISLGRNLTEEDMNDAESKNVLITRAYADRLFPGENPVGRRLQSRTPENPDTVVGIIEYMHGFWPGWDYLEHVMIYPVEPGSFNRGLRYLARTEPGEVAGILPTLEKQMLDLNSGRNLTIQTLTEIKEETFEDQRAVVKILSAVILLLVFVTSLGLVGITSFSVSERTHHIGTRRALGARKLDILRYFLTENWIITGLGIVLGILLTYGLNYLLVSLLSGIKMDLALVIYGIAGMWILGQVSAFFPAWKGARIPPARAIRMV